MTTALEVQVKALQNIRPIRDLSRPDLIDGYKTVPVLAFDIETHTQPKPHWFGHQLNKFGLSVGSPPREVALFHPDLPPVVLDFEDFDPYNKQPIPADIQEKINWLREVLVRDNVTTIGHNVIFDWRNIGVHFGFRIPLGARVWDTQIMGYRMGQGHQAHERAAVNDGFGLDDLAVRFGLLQHGTAFYDFYKWMKKQREDLSNLKPNLLREPQEHIAWQILGGFIPPNREDLLDTGVKRLIELYAAADAAITYRVYAKQLAMAEKLHDSDFDLEWEQFDEENQIVHQRKYHYTKYKELIEGDINPEFNSFLDFYTRLLRVKANQAIQGIPVDLKLLKRRMNEYKEQVEDLRHTLLDTPDPHDPYPEFEHIYAMMMYFKQISDCLRGEPGAVFSNPTNWVYWKPVRVAREVIRDAFFWDVPVDEATVEQWVDFFYSVVVGTEWDNTLSVQYTSRKSVEKAAPQTVAPRFDLQEWIRRNCYAHEEVPFDNFKARIKSEWLSHYYRITKNDVVNLGKDVITEKLRLREGMRFDRHFIEEQLSLKSNTKLNQLFYDYALEIGLARHREEKILGMDTWTPYYMYCIASAPLPTDEEFKYESGLTTQRFKDAVKQYNEENGHEPNYRLLALETWSLSYGTKAMDFFMGDDSAYAEKVEQLKPLREITQKMADIKGFEEVLYHAVFTGKVHSVVAPKARTGRMTSDNPNMQNKKIKVGSPFIGIFIAPENMTQVEIDLGSIEVALSNIMAGDHVGAQSREGTDLHMRRAEIYWEDEWAHLDKDQRKERRQKSKRVTFGDLYHAGAYLIATQIGVTVKEAYKLMEKLHQALWRTEEAKKKVIANCEMRYFRNGDNPPYVTPWDGTRIYVPISRDWKTGKLGPLGYVTWNYVVQAGVPAIMGRAMVLASETLERLGYKTYIAHEIHDALIIHFDDNEYLHPEKYERDVAQYIVHTLCNQVPERFLNRTTPKTHIIASICPSNRFKWGYREGQTYPYPLDEFVNEWGRFKLPDSVLAKDEKDWEAPDWFGPEHEGWTLEKETADIKRQRQNKKYQEAQEGSLAVVADGQEWISFSNILSEMLLNAENDGMMPAVRDAINVITMPSKVTYTDENGSIRDTGVLLFAQMMSATRGLHHRGFSEPYFKRLRVLRQIINASAENNAIQLWLNQYGFVFDVLNEEQEKTSA